MPVPRGRAGNSNVKARWRSAPGHDPCRARIRAIIHGRSVRVETAGEREDDPTFGPTEVYHRSTAAIVEPKLAFAKRGSSENDWGIGDERGRDSHSTIAWLGPRAAAAITALALMMATVLESPASGGCHYGNRQPSASSR